MVGAAAYLATVRGDDEHMTGPDEELTWQASHALALKQSYLGIQDAGRKT